MDTAMTFLAATDRSGAMRAIVNEQLALTGLSITPADAHMLEEQRMESLAEAERVEFGVPALTAIAEAVASSPCIDQDNVSDTLAELQSAFYALRDELPADIPDAEIIEALRGCLDELGDADEVATMPAAEIMAFSDEYTHAMSTDDRSVYRIVDEDGHVYSFDPTEWDYDEQAVGWDGERWSDDWDD